MVRILAVVLAAALGGASLGCYVFDELDNAQKVMNEHHPVVAPKTPPAEAAAATQSEAEKAKRSQVAQWWANARTLAPSETPTDPNEAIVPCRTRTGTILTRRGDCLSRGGHSASR